MISYWGVDHGSDEVSKAERKYPKGQLNPERAAAATLFGPLHAAYAAKDGQKMSATGRQLGYGIGGSVLGAAGGTAAGAALGNAAAGNLVGQSVGAIAGQYHGYRANAAKGKYRRISKRERKVGLTPETFEPRQHWSRKEKMASNRYHAEQLGHYAGAGALGAAVAGKGRRGLGAAAGVGAGLIGANAAYRAHVGEAGKKHMAAHDAAWKRYKKAGGTGRMQDAYFTKL